MEPKLDAIRRQLATPAAELQLDQKSWRDDIAASCLGFFRIPRLAWIGLAAAWLVIIALNVASSDNAHASATLAFAPTKRSPEMLQALREQQRLFAELVGAASEPADAKATRFVPRPRTERPVQISFA